MRVLIACEYSGVVRDAFIARGHDAMSCDILQTDVDGPHHEGDVRDILDDGWDMALCFPPCTHLCVSGAKHFEKKRADGRQQQGIDFFMLFTRLDIPLVCIENPVGIMSKTWRPPDQIIQPYFFGDEAQKTTCLWLKGLTPLVHIPEDDLFDNKTHVGKGEMIVTPSGNTMPKWYSDARYGGRSTTFQGFANAMANQWG